MSSANGRQIICYPKPKTHRLFKNFKPFLGNSEKLNLMIDFYFEKNFTEKQRQQILESGL
jgi:hypothetical protein